MLKTPQQRIKEYSIGLLLVGSITFILILDLIGVNPVLNSLPYCVILNTAHYLIV